MNTPDSDLSTTSIFLHAFLNFVEVVLGIIFLAFMLHVG